MNNIEQALNYFKLLHTPTELSYFYNKNRVPYSSLDYFLLNDSEKQTFNPELQQSVITLFQNIRQREYVDSQQITLKQLYNIITDPNNKNISKINRKVIYSSYNGERPVGRKAYEYWGGFQIIDMDIKDSSISSILKEKLFGKLNKYNWFIGVAFSSSGKGLHIYTKIKFSGSENDDVKKRELLYHVNFRHKYSFIYLALLKIINDISFINDSNENVEVTKDDVCKWLDLSMFRPAQGAFVPYDPHPLFSTNFFEDYIYVNFDNIEDLGHPDIDWISYPDLKTIFSKHEYFWNTNEESEKNIEVLDSQDPTLDTHNKVHYKHFERWRLANTLVKLYGLDKAQNYMRRICSDKIPMKEIQADCQTAARHNKEIDTWAVNQLNKYHGFNIKIKIDQEEQGLDVLYNNINNIDVNPIVMRDAKYYQEIHINKNQYLGNISKKLIKLCNMYRVTLLEAGAGLGKTEMVKQLVKQGKKILMVMPFTSTLTSKVENVENWTSYHSSKKVSLESSRGIAMTIDKFSKLSPIDIIDAEFDFIFIDESHLLFQSEYRPVMPKVIDMIKNTELRFILMTGTPTGETVFFDDISHIKVIKEDTRKKELNIFLTAKPIDNLCHMCESMADDIISGKHILFPTNKGTVFEKQLQAIIDYFLDKKHYNRKSIVHYYKKSNMGEVFMDDVNFKKTVNKTDVLICSSFLSVGVDILDRFDFNIYFNEIWMPQEVEQFSNRLRSHDLYIKLFLPNQDSDGNIIDIYKYNPYTFQLNDDEIKDVHSIVKICNGMVKRSGQEYKYNPIIKDILFNNPYINYNEVENKYYVNDIAFKTVMFERKYREYVQQLPVLIKGMQGYGYVTPSNNGSSVVKLGEYRGDISEEFIKSDDIQNLIKQVKNTHSIYATNMVDDLLEEVTEDRLMIYKEVMEGRYDIRKGKEFKEVDKDGLKVMYVKDIEVFEKVIPLFMSFSNSGYDIETIKEIFEHCINNNKYNFEAIKRIRKLTTLLYNDEQGRLDIPIKDFMTSSYDFYIKHNECKKVELDEFINNKSIEYANMDSDDKVVITRSLLTLKGLNEKLYDIFKCMFKVSRPKKDKVITIEKINIIWKTTGQKYESFMDQLGELDDLLGFDASKRKI